MKLWEEYYSPSSISEALQILGTTPGPACFIAGGTDLILDIQQGRHASIRSIIDITRIPELNQIQIQEKELFIGAAVPLSKIASSPLVFKHAQALTEACDLIGGPQVRNVATLGGNVAHALPAADGTIAMMCLDTRVLVAGPEGIKRTPLQEMFIGAGRSALKSDQELIVGFMIPLIGRDQASIFKRVMRMQGIALPILNLSIWLQRESETIRDIRISCGPSRATPGRIKEAEDILRGKRFINRLDQSFIEMLESSIPFRTSPDRATSEYRHHLLRILLEESLSKVWERALPGEPGK